MKRIRKTLVAVLVSFVFLGIQGSSFSVYAQNRIFVSPFEQLQNDRQMAEFIRQRTNRSTHDLVEQIAPDGSMSVDLKGRFQNIVLGKVNTYGELGNACVTNLNQANAFFGRDLEYGGNLYYGLFAGNQIADLAARHGMSQKEYLFYKNMIERALEEKSLSPNNSTISIVNNDGAGEGFNDPTAAAPEGGNTATTRGAQRLNVFNFAADIWRAFLDSNVTIQVASKFDPLPCTSTSGVLGGASATTLHGNFPNRELPNTWYIQALANKQAGADLSPNPDLSATFNSSINGNPGCIGGLRFYLGLDNTTPAGTVNLLITVMHEIGHGVGYSSFVDETDGTFFMGFTDVFTTYIFDRTTNKLWNQMTDAERMASAINNNNVLWDGASVKIASSGLTNGRDAATGRVELYTPSPVEVGSSVSHFNVRAFPNLLMEPDITLNLPLTLDLTRQLMRDIGWYRDTTADVVPDTITNVAPNSGALLIGSQATATWVNTGGFNKNVKIELSTNGGTTYPTVLATDVANTGSRTFTVPNSPTSQARIRVREHDFVQPAGSSSGNFTISNTAVPSNAKFDFDGDNKTDISIFRPALGQWWYLRSSDFGNRGFQFGNSTDKLVPADFTGDDKTDIAVWRPSSGEWLVLRSEDNTFFSFPFGVNGDIPAPGDFDGDNKSDAAVFRPSDQFWYIQNSGGGTTFQRFGVAEDKPTVADYDGDGKDDIAVFRPSLSQWWQFRSTAGVIGYQFGATGDKTVQGDYTGDGKADVALFRPSDRNWYILRSENASFYSVPFGVSTDIPSPGDYDGDGKFDTAVFRPSNNNWYIQGTTSGFFQINFGIANDKPIPNVYSVP